MSSRLIPLLITPLLAVSAPFAQTKPTAPTKPTTLPGPQPAQDPEVAGVEETPEERVAKLKAELAKVDKELKHIEQLKTSGGMVGHVQRALGLRSNKYRTYAPPRPKPARNTGGLVRKLRDEEAMNLPIGTRMVINGEPVSNTEYDHVFKFVSTYIKDEAPARKETVLNLAMQKAAVAENPKAAAANHKRMKLAHNRLVEGEMWDRLCKEISDCPSMQKNGDLGFLKPGARDPMFMAQAFSLEPGDRSDVFASTEGYHVIECLGKQDNAVHIRHILIRYSDQVPRVHTLVRRGQVDIASNESSDVTAKPGHINKGAAPRPGTPIRKLPQNDQVKLKPGMQVKKAPVKNDVAPKKGKAPIKGAYEVKKKKQGN